jgi:hypothetical protein
LLRRLFLLQAVHTRPTGWRVADVVRGVRDGPRDVLAWALLTELWDQVDDAGPKGRIMVEALRLFDDVPGLGYYARYEHAGGCSRPGAGARRPGNSWTFTRRY